MGAAFGDGGRGLLASMTSHLERDCVLSLVTSHVSDFIHFSDITSESDVILSSDITPDSDVILTSVTSHLSEFILSSVTSHLRVTSYFLLMRAIQNPIYYTKRQNPK